MRSIPRISIITCSYNHGQFIRETIESVLAQGYPDVEHIVVDGMSTDSTPAILAEYSHLKIIREPDKGQADAINKGFRAATGQILTFLNSDDTLEPGALRRVAAEILPGAGKHIVLGRCRFVDTDGVSIGVEHPSDYQDHERVLAIWKGYCIPQPAVFWSREVYERCGGLDEDEHLVLDYDLFCRYSRAYEFHVVDDVFASYRLHDSSKSMRASDEERLRNSIRVSRRYWPSWSRPMRWRLESSLLGYRIDRKGRAARWLARSRERLRNRKRIHCVTWLAMASIVAPDVVWASVLFPRAHEYLGRAAPRVLSRILPSDRKKLDPRTEAYLANTDPWPDGWVGPRLLMKLSCKSAAEAVVIVGEARISSLRRQLTLSPTIDGKSATGQCQVMRDEQFFFEVRPPGGLCVGEHTLEVNADTWFVPHASQSNGDFRPLAWRLLECKVLASGGNQNDGH